MRWGTPIERFFEKVKIRSDGHWEWTGGRKEAGYGQFWVDRRKIIAHRWAYETFVGEIPDGKEIDHLCRNAWCVNPEHLEPVSRLENTTRAKAHRTHCKLVLGGEVLPDLGEQFVSVEVHDRAPIAHAAVKTIGRGMRRVRQDRGGGVAFRGSSTHAGHDPFMTCPSVVWNMAMVYGGRLSASVLMITA